MSQSTLSFFGVPTGSGTGRGGIIQPKQKMHFRVRVVNFGPVAGGIELTQQVQTVTRPTLEQGEVELHSYNSIAYYAAKPKWNSIELTLRDDVTNSALSLVGYQIQKQMNHYAQTTPLAGANYKFQLWIDTLDGGDDGVLETWFLEGCFISTSNHNEFDYSTAEPMLINLTIRYDNATLNGGLMPAAPVVGTGPMIG